MINDENRGFAWTRALLGVCAREIHVAGGMEAAPVVEAMAARTGDDFELRTYERLSKLV
jgi:ATP-dependent RNA helicase SUPV3L1/SUV3